MDDVPPPDRDPAKALAPPVSPPTRDPTLRATPYQESTVAPPPRPVEYPATLELPAPPVAGRLDATLDAATLTMPPAGPSGLATATHTPDMELPGSGPTSGRRVPLPSIPGYDLLGVLGRGGMGVVYKARQQGLDRLVALKMVLAAEHATADQLGRFLAEARAVALIRHRHIVQIFEIGEQAGRPYFSLEFCPGGSLDQKIKNGPLPPRTAATVVAQLADGMAAAHAAGVIHRDLKPANVLLDADGTPKVTDFGLARAIDDDSGRTRSGSVLGTPSFMAPEQARGDQRAVGPHSDQYSLGATLYDLLTGRPPFKGTSVVDTLDQVLTREPAPPTLLVANCPRDLETICLKTLQKDPAKRYADCTALADDLRRFLDGRPITARPVGLPERLVRWTKRNPRVAGLVGAVLALLVLVAAVSTVFATTFYRQRNDLALTVDRAEKGESNALANLELAVKNEKEANENYDFARTDMSNLVTQVPRQLEAAAVPPAVRLNVLKVLDDLMQAQLARGNPRGLSEKGVYILQLEAGNVAMERKKFPEAVAAYTSARAIIERLRAAETKELDKADGNLGLCLRSLGDATLEANATIDGGRAALDLYRQALALQEGVAERPRSGEIPVSEARQSVALTLFKIAEVGRRRGIDFPKALDDAEASLAIWRDLAKGPPTDPHAYRIKVGLAGACYQVGKLRMKVSRDAEAKAAYQEALDLFAALTASNPGNLQFKREVSAKSEEYGNFLFTRGEVAEAEKRYAAAATLTRSLMTTPEHLELQREFSLTQYYLGTVAHKRGNRAAADRAYRECLRLRLEYAALNPKDLTAVIRVMVVEPRCGVHAAGSARAAKLLEQFPKNQTVLIESACCYALCAPAVTHGRDPATATPAERMLRGLYLRRSLDLVARLLDGGYKDRDRLATDPDLEPVQSLPAFKVLLARLPAPR